MSTNGATKADLWKRIRELEAQVHGPLCSAAPDLLEAARKALGLLVMSEKYAGSTIADDLRAAIAKAEGK